MIDETELGTLVGKWHIGGLRVSGPEDWPVANLAQETREMLLALLAERSEMLGLLRDVAENLGIRSSTFERAQQVNSALLRLAAFLAASEPKR